MPNKEDFRTEGMTEKQLAYYRWREYIERLFQFTGVGWSGRSMVRLYTCRACGIGGITELSRYSHSKVHQYEDDPIRKMAKLYQTVVALFGEPAGAGMPYAVRTTDKNKEGGEQNGQRQ